MVRYTSKYAPRGRDKNGCRRASGVFTGNRKRSGGRKRWKKILYIIFHIIPRPSCRGRGVVFVSLRVGTLQVDFICKIDTKTNLPPPPLPPTTTARNRCRRSGKECWREEQVRGGGGPSRNRIHGLAYTPNSRIRPSTSLQLFESVGLSAVCAFVYVCVACMSVSVCCWCACVRGVFSS